MPTAIEKVNGLVLADSKISTTRKLITTNWGLTTARMVEGWRFLLNIRNG